jgi:hypothetical protein
MRSVRVRLEVTLEPVLEVEVTLRYESWVVLSISSCCCNISLELLRCISSELLHPYCTLVRVTLRLTVRQSVSTSWCRAHFVDVWPDIVSFSRVWVWNSLSCLCGPGLSFVSHSLVICLYIYYHNFLSVPARYSRLCPTFTSSSRGNGSLDTWAVATTFRRNMSPPSSGSKNKPS